MLSYGTQLEMVLLHYAFNNTTHFTKPHILTNLPHTRV